jgi:flagellar biosynthetic protein FlhB
LKGGANLEELTEKLKIFRISLQFFADTGDKTEQATPKRRSEARKKGQVVKSQEIVSSIVLLVSFIAMKTLGSSLYEKISGLTKTVFEVYMKDEDIFTIHGITKLTAELSIWFLQTMLPIFSLIMVMGVIANLMQSGFLFTLETIKPKFSNISPLGGIKNAFSFKSLLEFFSKALIKVVIVGIIAYTTIKDNIENIIGIMNFNVASIGQYIMAFSIDIGIKISSVSMEPPFLFI